MSDQIINNDALDGRIDTRVDERLEDFEGGGGEGVSDETERMLWTNGSPRFVEQLPTGSPDGQYHEPLGWGIQFRVRELAQLRSVAIDAQEPGMLTTRVHRLSDDSMDAGTQPPRPYAVREHELDESGEQRIDIEVTLRPGNYFIERHDGPPLRRVADYDRWDEIQETDVPVEPLRGWHLDYRPREEDAHERYMEGGWPEYFYYFFAPEFGIGSPLDSDDED